MKSISTRPIEFRIQSKLYIPSFIFVCCFLVIYHIPQADAFLKCEDAIWDAWGKWSSCPSDADGSDPTLVMTRKRNCKQLPGGCFLNKVHQCFGEPVETLICGQTTTPYTYTTIDFGTTMLEDTTMFDTTLANTTPNDQTESQTGGTDGSSDAVTESSDSATGGTDGSSSDSVTDSSNSATGGTDGGSSDGASDSVTDSSNSVTGGTDGGSSDGASDSVTESSDSATGGTDDSSSDSVTGATDGGSSDGTSDSVTDSSDSVTGGTDGGSSDGTSDSVTDSSDSVTGGTDGGSSDGTSDSVTDSSDSVTGGTDGGSSDGASDSVTDSSDSVTGGTEGGSSDGASDAVTDSSDSVTGGTDGGSSDGASDSVTDSSDSVTGGTDGGSSGGASDAVTDPSDSVTGGTGGGSSDGASDSVTDSSDTVTGGTDGGSDATDSSDSITDSSDSATDSSDSFTDSSDSSDSITDSSDSVTDSSDTITDSSDSATDSSDSMTDSSDSVSDSSDSVTDSSDSMTDSSDSVTDSSDSVTDSSDSVTDSSDSMTYSSDSVTDSSDSFTDSSDSATDSSDSSDSFTDSSDSATDSSDSFTDPSDSATDSSDLFTDSSDSFTDSSDSATDSSDSSDSFTDSSDSATDSSDSFTDSSDSFTDSIGSSDSLTDSTGSTDSSDYFTGGTDSSDLPTDNTNEPGSEVIPPMDWTTCNDCSHLNVHLYHGNPYNDASSVLNRYSSENCHYVQFFCRPIEIGDMTPVATILSQDVSDLSVPLSSTYACRDGQWWLTGKDGSSKKAVTSLGCTYIIPTSLPPTGTTLPQPDPKCMECRNLVVEESTHRQGVAYLDHFVNDCLTVEAHCLPINGGNEVEMMVNLERTFQGGHEVNRTFTCNEDGEWFDLTTNRAVNNISCIMPNEPVITTTMMTDSATDSSDYPTESSDVTEDSTDAITDNTEVSESVTPAGGSSDSSAETESAESSTEAGASATPSDEITDSVTDSATTENDALTTETNDNTHSMCGSCPNMESARALNQQNSYDGMIVLYNYESHSDGCKYVDISCQGHKLTEHSTLLLNPYGEVSSGPMSHETTLKCSDDGQWKYNEQIIESVSCLVDEDADVDPFPITPIISTTTINPNNPMCTQCSKLQITPSRDEHQANGFATVYINNDNDCHRAVVTCSGITGNEEIQLHTTTTSLVSGRDTIQFEFICNAAASWMTSAGTIIDNLMCTYEASDIPNRQPSQCAMCSNMKAKALSEVDGVKYNGMIVLDHNMDGDCRKVDISCGPTYPTENATIYFGNNVVAVGPITHHLTMKCDDNGNWNYEGKAVASVSCLISDLDGGLTAPPTTPTTTTVANPFSPQCSRCGRAPIVPVDEGSPYSNGFSTIIHDQGPDGCAIAYIKCEGASMANGVALLAGGLPIASGYGWTATNLTCSDTMNWMNSRQETVTALSCGTKKSSQVVPQSTTLATNGECDSCENVRAVARPENDEEYNGMVVVDHWLDSTSNCRKAYVKCDSGESSQQATLFMDEEAVKSGIGAQSVELICNAAGQWEMESKVVSSAGCLIQRSAGAPVTDLVTTTIATTTNPSESLCAQCSRVPVSVVRDVTNGFTTVVTSKDTYGCSIADVYCQGITEMESVSFYFNNEPMTAATLQLTCNSNGRWTHTNYGEVDTIGCVRASSQQPSMCQSCSNMRPRSVESGSVYDGLIIISHTRSACRKATIACKPTYDHESAELQLDGTSVPTNDIELACGANGQWEYEQRTVSSVSCAVTGQNGRKRRAIEHISKRQSGGTPCSSCSQLPIVSLQSMYPYMNGFATVDVEENNDGCLKAVGMCEGTSPDQSTAWIIQGDPHWIGVGHVNNSFICNAQQQWQSEDGIQFSDISCGRAVPATTPSSGVMNCPNLIAEPIPAQELSHGESNGQLVLDHHIDTQIMAKVVSITCYGSSTSDEAKLRFNQNSQEIEDTGMVTITITCSENSQWMRNGQPLETVSCLIKTPNSVITPPPLTTPPPIATTTIAGSSPITQCSRDLMQLVPDNYVAGYLSMVTEITDTSLTVQMACYSPDGDKEAAIMFADGTELTSGSSMTNLTLECNSNSQWVISSTTGSGVAIGTVVTKLSCVTEMHTTPNPMCRQCENLDAIGLTEFQLAPNEINGQFIIDHYSDDDKNCRVAYLTCAGRSLSENSTIIFDGGVTAYHKAGITSTQLQCSPQSTWDWYGNSVSFVSCKVTSEDNVSSPSTPQPLPPTGEDGLPLSMQCNRDFLKNIMMTGESGAYLIMDTIVENQALRTTLMCSPPDNGGTAIIKNGDGTVLGQSVGSEINATLICNSNAQWELHQLSPTADPSSSIQGTIITGLECSEVAAEPQHPSTGCQHCPNMKAIALKPEELEYNEKNGELLLDHSVEPSTQCRIVIIKCRGENTQQNATIYFNDKSMTISAQSGQVSTSLACSEDDTWQRIGQSITGIACKVSSDITVSSPIPITTEAPDNSRPGCNRDLVAAVGSGELDSAFMTVDTVIMEGVMTALASCSSPKDDQTVVIVDSENNRLKMGTGNTNITLTCNSDSNWVTNDNAIVKTISCGAIPAVTTTPTNTVDCSMAQWSEWHEWSECTDSCGSCGTHQRFRSCNKPSDDCQCAGSAYEKENCNLAVCKYPRVSCCEGFNPMSSGGTFVCLKTAK